MIPNKLHYVHLSRSGRPWKLHHYLSVKSAYERGGFDDITIWVDDIPEGVLWSKTTEMVNVIQVEPPQDIFGLPITQPAHQSDVIRLQVLLEVGGVYVDTDTIFVKPFTDLLDNKFVLGQQGVGGAEGLCPAVIMSERASFFGQSWLLGFKDSFQGGPPGSAGWCTHSVNYPMWLAQQIPTEVTILPHDYFFWPLYHESHVKALFEEVHEFPNAYSHHLWESSGKKYLDNLTVKDIKENDTTFNLLVRDLV